MIFLARIFKCPSESGLLLHTITEKGNMSLAGVFKHSGESGFIYVIKRGGEISLAGVFKRPGEGGFQYCKGKGENISRRGV